MHISKKQRAIINSAVKPFYITSNDLGPGLQNLLEYYSKYFAQRRFSIIHFLPIYKNTRNSYLLTVRFNAFFKKGGFAKKRRPITWTFYGNTLLTKYGRRKQKKELKRKRKKARRQRACVRRKITTHQQPSKEKEKETINVAESSASSSNDSNSGNSKQTCDEENEQIPIPAKPVETDTVITDILKENNLDLNAEESDFGDDTGENIWNLDIQEVAALITEGEQDENQLGESMIVSIEFKLLIFEYLNSNRLLSMEYSSFAYFFPLIF